MRYYEEPELEIVEFEEQEIYTDLTVSGVNKENGTVEDGYGITDVPTDW